MTATSFAGWTTIVTLVKADLLAFSTDSLSVYVVDARSAKGCNTYCEGSREVDVTATELGIPFGAIDQVY
jgi:hypothetical protein